ncbi:hypothetical protein EU805_11350 [Salipiger sp. IMCC34102]|uniref:hypothetical protein n=1 Tax=Salipiger sp. IMCC34102 TaxID=2510647 RepID=UPI00101DB7CC|nr:hypothetical protein [Salipiger sp. IMCC34102]RYH01788.1 hypothetical protein EU805_11350 [Salipiger sp. IMCC34102]
MSEKYWFSSATISHLTFKDICLFHRGLTALANAVPSGAAGEIAISLLHELAAGARTRKASSFEEMLWKILCVEDPDDGEETRAMIAEIGLLLGVELESWPAFPSAVRPGKPPEEQ